MRAFVAASALLVLAACSPTSRPADVTASDACGHCRMVVSSPRFAAQIAAPGEDPVFFDDIGCLSRALAGATREFAYVADHRTGEWVRAADAIYTRVATLATPMGSHIIAHADSASREQDPAAATGVLMSASDVFEQKEGETAHGR